MKTKERYNMFLDIATSLGREVKTSKNGSDYFILCSFKYNTTSFITPFSITKNQLHKLGDNNIHVVENTLLFFKKRPFLLHKGRKFFSYEALIILKRLRGHFSEELYEDLQNLFVRDYKGEWLKNYPKLLPYSNFMKSFNSPKEVKNFLGFKNTPLKDFLEFDMEIAIYMGCFTNERNKIKAMQHDSNYIIDVVIMLNKVGLTDYPCPSDFKKLHNDLSYLLASQQYSSEIFNTEDNLEDKLKGLKYEKIVTPTKLAIEGINMGHCVVARLHYLTKALRTYYHIEYNGNPYTLEYCVKTNKILECKGKFNDCGDDLVNYIEILLAKPFVNTISNNNQLYNTPF